MFHKRPERVIAELTVSEIRFIRCVLVDWYNRLLADGKPTEDVAAMIVKFSKL